MGALEPPTPERVDPSGQRRFDEAVSGIAALGDPIRRALYRWVVAQPEWVNRDQAADGVGVARHVAKFGLDRLVADGLLEVEYRRPEGRSGPGAGRPAKLYRRASREVSVSLPDRRYELSGRLLAQAVTDAQRDAIPVADALTHAARATGRSLGQQARRRIGPPASRPVTMDAISEVLDECGYEPRTDATGLTLANCPFHSLSRDFTELVCGMNLDLMHGLLEGVGPCGLTARLDPAPGRCCVRLVTPAERPSADSGVAAPIPTRRDEP